MSPNALTFAERPRPEHGIDHGRRSLIEELESALSGREVQQRADVLRRLTDLFIAGSQVYSEDQAALFDDVMCRVAAEVERSARALLAERVAPLDAAPPNLVHALATDEAIEVAGPVLTQFAGLDEATLVETARNRSQAHLLAISRRTSLGEAVTDVLVERGDRAVTLSTLGNPGSRFSGKGCETLAKRSGNDIEIARQFLTRDDIPRQYTLKLLARCSESVRRALTEGGRQRAEILRGLVDRATDRLQTQSREASAASAAARERVDALHRQGELDEAGLRGFARGGDFDTTAVALALICNLPIAVIERALVNESGDQLIVIARAAGFSWETTAALVHLREAERPASSAEIERLAANFHRLKPETAEKAMQFYRLRARAART